MIGRMIRNIAKFPARTVDTLKRRFDPMYRIQRKADRYAKAHLDKDLYRRLCDVPGESTERQCRLLFYLAATASVEGLLVEIGSYKGRSTAWLAAAARQGGRRLVSIDPHLRDSLDTFQQTVQQFDIESIATLHRAMSHDVGRDWSEPIAFLWVDGSHEYEDVKQDIADFMPHLQPNAMVVFDDYNHDRFAGVVRAIDECTQQDDRFEMLGTIKTFALVRRCG